MKKRFCIMMILGLCITILSACIGHTASEDAGKWDCSVSCAAASSADSYVITYSDEEIISKTGKLSFQNRNDFDITVHLLTAGKTERKAEIPAYGVSILFQIEKDVSYTVGCHADVDENTEINLVVYDGERADPY